MIRNMFHVANLHAVGVLGIDEIQHLNQTRGVGADLLLNFLVTLVNTIGIPVLIVGTHGAMPVLQGNFRQARRASGVGGQVWDNLKPDRTWDHFVETMWRYQWTQEVTPLTDDLRQVLYEESQGIIDVVVKLFMLAQLRAIRLRAVRRHPERLDRELLLQVVAQDFNLLPEFCQGQVTRGGQFGEGLALTGDPAVLWPMIREAIRSVEPGRRDFSIAFGFLAGIAKSNPLVAAEILDGAVTDPVFGVRFPALQSVLGLDDVGCVRLRRAMDLDLATISSWECCVWRDDNCVLPAADLARLVGTLLSKPEGELAVVSILHRRVDQQCKHGELPESLAILARTVIGNLNCWSAQKSHWDYELAELIKIVLTGPDGVDAARSMVANMTAVAGGDSRFFI
jgi:hypothetical protein